MYENMTDDEFFALIEEKYGKDWTPQELDGELAEEYGRRIESGF